MKKHLNFTSPTVFNNFNVFGIKMERKKAWVGKSKAH